MEHEQKISILLVDDKPENLLALEAILESLGENLVRATSGEEALRCLLYQDFAVILLDVQMPKIDGFETATLIRNRGRSHQTPILFLTAFSNNEEMQFEGYAIGAVDYLTKPINSDILTSKVKVFVDLYKKTLALKQQTDVLKQSEERFRSLSNCVPVGIFETDTQGHYTYNNPRYQAICGLTSQECLVKGWLECVHPEDRESAIASWDEYIREGRGREYSQEFRLQTKKDDPIRWIYVRSSPMLCSLGKLVGYVGSIEDISVCKQAEEVRAQVAQEKTARLEAEKANRMKDEFLAVLSHELRTPLTSMLGWSKILRTTKLGEAETARAIDAIERNAISQSQLIEDILDISRIIRGKLRLNLSVVNLVSITQAALEALRPLAQKKDIQLNLTLDTSLGSISGDSARLQQIVWNLLSNAIKFTPNGGKVEVRLTTVEKNHMGASEELSSTPQPLTPLNYPHAQLQVIDTGIGITPDFLPQVFDHFRQSDSSTTRSHSGLGLGLAIVRRLVELHGGTIIAESPGKGQGANFTVRLPLLLGNRRAGDN
jgi:PAS domain S-box-containing protein